MKITPHLIKKSYCILVLEQPKLELYEKNIVMQINDVLLNSTGYIKLLTGWTKVKLIL